jgi:hypothetical protein
VPGVTLNLFDSTVAVMLMLIILNVRYSHLTPYNTTSLSP